jgi:diguanylate cyclase (GGDEF)-like protein
LLAAGAVALGTRFASLAPLGALPVPGALMGLAVVGAAAAMHRPLAGPGLGLGAAVVPVVVALFGGVPAALCGAATLVLTESVRRGLERQSDQGPPERRNRLRILSAAARCALAALAAGIAWALLPHDPPWAALGIAGLAYLSVLAALDAAEGKLRIAELDTPSRRFLALSLDAGGYVVGAGLAGAAASPLLSALVLTALGLLSIEAARNAFHRQALARRVFRLESLGRASQRLGVRGNELTDLAGQIREEVGRVVPFHWFHLELENQDGEHSFRSGPQGVLEEGRPSPGKTPPRLPGIHRRSAWHLVDRPLTVEGRTLGRLRLWCDPRLLEGEAVELLDLLLPQMAALVERTLLDREAKHDALTGLVVRRVFEGELREAFDRACREGLPLAVVLCDLDHFKSINDTHGHDAGDAALVHVARILQARDRDEDVCCRYGGEEFALLLRESDGPAALAIAERLRRAVADAPVELPVLRLPLTLSAGIAAFPALFVRTPAELLTLADTALYAAKGSGRNRCLLNLGHDRYRDSEGIARLSPGPAAGAEKG